MTASAQSPMTPIRTTVALPDLAAAIDEAVHDLLGITQMLTELEVPLAARIERNRERSRRNRQHNGSTNGNGDRDDRIVLGRTGLRVECRRCDRVLAAYATPEPKNTNGGTR